MSTPPSARLKIAVHGAVQGVGFRPFIHRLATELHLNGWVNNSAQGVFLEVEGPRAEAEQFLRRLETEKPVHSIVQRIETSWLEPAGYQSFEIRASETNGSRTALVLPDIASCPDCLKEVLDPNDRRYRYPFTNCTRCGPRFSIIESIPYDRANTSMHSFPMCPLCQAEYDDPEHRRFHAQPNACPACGPHLELWNPEGDALFGGDEALRAAAHALRSGKIVAVKGLGGFQLMVAAHRENAVRTLRRRKDRKEKPLALMFPSLEQVKEVCEVSPLEERLLCSSETPIVLLRRRLAEAPGPRPGKRCRRGAATRLFAGSISRWVAPGNPYLGVMLPCTPLHHLLLHDAGFPVVATSGNLSDEPICISETEALQRLGGIADLFLVHNRPIVRPVDDSVVRVMMNREMVLRRARGYAPLPIRIEKAAAGKSIFAAGAYLKNTVAVSVGPQVFISQHVGDLETEEAVHAHRSITADLGKLCDADPEILAADMHPDYPSTRLALAKAEAAGCRLVKVQHHIAHVLSCLADNELSEPVLGVSWDGTGFGPGGAVWGGEFFLVDEQRIDRFAHFRTFRLPGGDKAIKEPRRTAAGVLFEMYGRVGLEELRPAVTFSPAELAALRVMLARRVNSPACSSVGRLFDAVAALLGVRQRVHFEGQAAMELEFAMEGVVTSEAYPLLITRHNPDDPQSELVVDWFPLFEAMLADRQLNVPVGEISARFHNTLAESVVRVAKKAARRCVVLSGGCFQNRYLTERTVQRLWEEGFDAYWHRRVPPNDGGIALGQVLAAQRAISAPVEGPSRSFLTALLPEHAAEHVEAESHALIARCACGCERSVADLGGVHWKAAGRERRLLFCARCGQPRWHAIITPSRHSAVAADS